MWSSPTPIRAGPSSAMLDESDLPAEFAERVREIDFRGTMGRVHLAVDRLPAFVGFPSGEQAPHRSLTVVGADLEAFERAWVAQQAGEIAADPAIEMTIQSVLDDSLAPAGSHIITTGIQQLPFELAEGSWDDGRERLVRTAIEGIERYAPGFEASVVGAAAVTPLDLERDYGLSAGNLFHGAMNTDQLFAARPLPGYSTYRAPVGGLYLCGAGMHPGGGVTGAPGHNGARAVLRDLGKSFAGESGDLDGAPAVWPLRAPRPAPRPPAAAAGDDRARPPALAAARRRPGEVVAWLSSRSSGFC